MDPICSVGGNVESLRVAYEAGFMLGTRSDRLTYDFPIGFVDINYKTPDFRMHLEVVKKHRPRYATVPDLSDVETSEADIARAVTQADTLSNYCEIPLIVPKRSEQLALIPPGYALAYSVPSEYGGALYGGPWRLTGRRVHLLGGSPHMQMKLYQFLQGSDVEIVSADGNMAHRLAKLAWYWQAGGWRRHAEYKQGVRDLYKVCWRLSCQNIYWQWQMIVEGSYKPSKLRRS